jgi:SulP family sulfate permease
LITAQLLQVSSIISELNKFFNFKHFKSDAFGGITAGIVALPLALAFGEQSGLGAAAGLYGAAFIAFFAAMFGGTSTQISGPTAPMTALSMVVIAGLLQASEGKIEEALPMILMVFLLAGFFQILLGVIKVGTYIKYIPYTVVSGFMTGIGVIILITQIPASVGYNAGEDQAVVDKFLPHAEELILDRILMEEAQEGYLVLENFQETSRRAETITPEDIRLEAITLATNDSKGVIGSLKYLPQTLENINLTELLLCLITIVIIFGFKRITKAVPSTLVALLVVSAGAYYIGVEYVLIREIPSGIPELHFEIFSELDLLALVPYIITALMLALLGAIDSLLTSVVADNLTKTQHKPNRELIGQGIGNSIAALFGGLPGAGATIRTVVNIQAGGKTKLSGMMAGVLLFVILLVLGPIASQIPAGVLAGILITVGIGVMDYKGLKALPKMESSEKVILLTVLVLTVFWQLVFAVGVGLVLAAVVFLKRMSDVSNERAKVSSNTGSVEELWDDEVVMREDLKDKVKFKHMDGPMFFGVASDFKQLISSIGDIHMLVIRMEKVPFIDQSGLYALETAIEELHDKGVVVALCGANDQADGILHSMKIVPQMVPQDHVFDDFEQCKVWLRDVLGTNEKLQIEVDRISPKAEV